MKRKLSKIGWLILICCIVLVGSLAYAKPGDFKPGSEPDGFRGIKWGQSPSTVGELVYQTSDGGIDCYTREDDELKMGAAELELILYFFWQDKFHSVMITTKGFFNWDYFKAVVFEKFGEGYQDNEYIEGYKYVEGYMWNGENAWMVLCCSDFVEEGALFMASAQMTALQEEWEKEQAKKGAEEGW